MLVIVSDIEKEELTGSDYGYNEDEVQVLGLPRYDYLEKLDDLMK